MKTKAYDLESVISTETKGSLSVWEQEEIAVEIAIDKIEMLRSQQESRDADPSGVARFGSSTTFRSIVDLQKNNHLLGVFTDPEDGIVAMFDEIHQCLLPNERMLTQVVAEEEQDDDDEEEDRISTTVDEESCGASEVLYHMGRSKQSSSSSSSAAAAAQMTSRGPVDQVQESRLAAWQTTLVAQFLQAWQQVEASATSSARSVVMAAESQYDEDVVAVTDDDVSMLAMFREIGSATCDELTVHGRQMGMLSQALLLNMQTAMQRAAAAMKRVPKELLLTDDDDQYSNSDEASAAAARRKYAPVSSSSTSQRQLHNIDDDLDLSLAAMFHEFSRCD